MSQVVSGGINSNYMENRHLFNPSWQSYEEKSSLGNFCETVLFS